MHPRLERFLAGSPWWLTLFAVGFVIAGVGVALAFATQGLHSRPLAFVALGIVVLGVAVGWVALILGLGSKLISLAKVLRRGGHNDSSGGDAA